MKISLSNIFLLILAVGLGIGWYVDRRQLLSANEKLNEEATDLFSRWSLAATPQSGFASVGTSQGQPRVYVHNRAEDRAAFIRDFERARDAGFLYGFGWNTSNGSGPAADAGASTGTAGSEKSDK